MNRTGVATKLTKGTKVLKKAAERRPRSSDLRDLRDLCGNCSFLLLLLFVAQARAAQDPRPDVCGKYLYIPPDLAGSVVFYHSFSRGADQPEINLLKARITTAGNGRIAPALTGSGYRHTAKKGGALGLTALSRPLTKPITVSLWFRLEEPMRPETCFHLISLRANGYISNFVRGKGQWCALQQPTFVVQLYRFPGISNVNGIRFGDAWLPERKWHHAAVSVSEGSRVRVYWNARLRSEFCTRGRLFNAGDAIKGIDLGPHWLGHPMTIDEVLILNRPLSPADVQAYVTAVRKLADARFPFQP